MLYKTLIVSALFITQLFGKGPCDQKLECYKRAFASDDRALCTGYKACARADFGTTLYNPICAGAQACMASKITAAPPKVLCNGFEACYGVKKGLEATEKVACNGMKACREIVGSIKAPIVTCDGNIACINKKLIATGITPAGEDNLISCNGKKSCEGSNLISDSRVDCDGDTTCKTARIEADIIGCQGKRGCYDSNMFGPSIVYGYGFLGAAKSKIMAPPQGRKPKPAWTFDIKMLGMNSGLYSKIITGGARTTILGYGYRALVGASIRCVGGSKCKLVCRVNACKNTKVFVDRKSDIELDPVQCDPRDLNYVGMSKKNANLPAKALGIHCPSLTMPGKGGIPIDADIDELADQWELERMNDPEYIEMIESTEAAEEALDAMINEEVASFEDYLDLSLPDQEENELMVVGNKLITSNDSGAMSNILTSNLLTALVVFIMTCIGSLCYIAYKFGDNGSIKPLLQDKDMVIY